MNFGIWFQRNRNLEDLGLIISLVLLSQCMLVSLWNGKETGFLFDNLRNVWLEETIEVRGSSNKQEKEKNPRKPIGNVSSLTCVHLKGFAKIFKHFHSSVTYPKKESLYALKGLSSLKKKSKNYYFLRSHLVSLCLARPYSIFKGLW